MKRSLFSDRWYRVADLHPRIRSDVQIDRQIVRDELWYLLSVGGKSRSFRMNAAAWAFVGRCSAECSMQQVWDTMLAARPEGAPTQDEVVQLLTRLYQAGLIEFERSPDVELMLEQTRRADQAERKSRLNPLSFRVSLGDPSGMLERLLGWSTRMFGPAGLIAWCALMTVGMAVLLANWDAAVRHASLWMQTPRYILIGWLCYPLIKAVHELGHAMAVTRWGGRVQEAGLGLFFMLPMPYVDASDANRFAKSRRRAVVSAAGILVELAVASIALLLWSITEAGLVNDMAFTLAFIGGVSTLLFNANPLMRLDGYYLLSDLVQLPNLAGRSANWWQWATLRYLLRARDAEAPTIARGETPWLVAYGPLSWAYRVMLSIWMIVWGGSYHPMLGVLVAIAVLVWMFGIPFVQAMRNVGRSFPRAGTGVGVRARVSAIVVAIALTVIALPLPDRMLAQGVVWLPDEARLRPSVEGFLKTIAPSGARVKRGEPVAELEDPSLDTEYQRLISRRDGLQTGLYQALATDTFKGKQVSEDIAALDARIAHIGDRLAELAVPASAGGLVTAGHTQDMPGRFYKQGSELAFVVGEVAPLIRVAVNQEDAARLRDGVHGVSVRLSHRIDQVFDARVKRFMPSAVGRLPTPALGDRAGGEIVVDPTDKDGTRTLMPVYLLDLDVPGLPVEQIGGRVWVRIDYGWSPISMQVYRYLKQLVLVRFSPLES